MYKRLLLGAGVIALSSTFLFSPVAQAGSPRDRATGGGQTLVGTGGAGNTIAFTAQNRDGGSESFATGQVQYIDRSVGTGQDQVRSHGVVSCLIVTGNTAVIGGTWTKGDRTGNFEIQVVDNGEGVAASNDVITIDDVAKNADCSRDDNDNETPDAELARGNAQVYDAT